MLSIFKVNVVLPSPNLLIKTSYSTVSVVLVFDLTADMFTISIWLLPWDEDGTEFVHEELDWSELDQVGTVGDELKAVPFIAVAITIILVELLSPLICSRSLINLPGLPVNWIEAPLSILTSAWDSIAANVITGLLTCFIKYLLLTLEPNVVPFLGIIESVYVSDELAGNLCM